MPNKKTLVLGASENPARYSNLAIKKLLAHNYEVVAIGRREGKVANVNIIKTPLPFENIDTVTLYLNALNQKQYEMYILSLQPKRIIFNPGSENDSLAKIAITNGIQVTEACTLVLLSTGQY